MKSRSRKAVSSRSGKTKKRRSSFAVKPKARGSSRKVPSLRKIAAMDLSQTKGDIECFVNTTKGSNKYWINILDGKKVTRWWGKIGKTSDTKTWVFPTRMDAVDDTYDMIASKKKKGYREVTLDRLILMMGKELVKDKAKKSKAKKSKAKKSKAKRSYKRCS